MPFAMLRCVDANFSADVVYRRAYVIAIHDT